MKLETSSKWFFELTEAQISTDIKCISTDNELEFDMKEFYASKGLPIKRLVRKYQTEWCYWE